MINELNVKIFDYIFSTNVGLKGNYLENANTEKFVRFMIFGMNINFISTIIVLKMQVHQVVINIYIMGFQK